MVDNFDTRTVNESWKDNEELMQQNAILLEDESVQGLFSGYYYDAETAPLTPAPAPIPFEMMPKDGSLAPSSQQTAEESARHR